MSRWVDQFNNLGIHKTIKDGFDALDFERKGVDSEVEAERLRLQKGFDLLENVLAGIDPDFHPESQLVNLTTHLNQHVVREIANYGANGNVQHLRNANDHFTSQLAIIYQFAGMTKPADSRKVIKGLEAAYDSFCKSIDETKEGFATDVEKKRERLSQLEVRTAAVSNALEELQTATDRQISTWQTEFTDAQTTRAEEHSEAQINRGKEYDKALRDIAASADRDQTAMTKKYDRVFKSAFDKYAENVSTKTADINDMHESILEIHGLVTNDGVAGGYKKGADDEQKAAFWWSIASMACYGLIFIWVLFKGKLGFGIAGNSTVDWPVVVTTISVTAVAFVAAQFAGKQSRIHRMNEQRMRWFSFEIAAIDPFISSLKPDQQHELKKQLSERLFGQDRVIEDMSMKTGGLDSKTLKSVTDAIKTVRQ